MLFTAACAEHALGSAGRLEAAHELVNDSKLAAAAGYIAVSAYCAALAVAKTSRDAEQAYRLERAWQGAWIARELL